MVPYSLLRFLVLCYYLLPLLAEDENEYQGNCPTSFHCGKLGDIHFPFTNKSNPECGLLIKGCDDENAAKEVQLGNGRWYVFETINWDNSISVIDYKLQSLLSSNSCDISNYYLNATLPPSSPIMSFQIEMEHNITLFRCDTNQSHSLRYYEYFCDGYNIYYPSGSTGLGQFDYFTNFGYTCSTNQLPSKLSPSSPWTNLPFYGVSDLFSLLTAEFRIQIVLSGDCRLCYENDGQCRVDKGKFVCVNSKGQSHSPREKRWASKVNIAIIGLAMGFLTLMTFSFLILFLHKRRYSLSDVQNQTKHIYSGPNSNPLPESGIVFFGTRVFSHRELKEVTNNFDEAKELGSGGFGTVYYGKLRDGREVAVKRLYQHNYRQVEQFMNEIEILTRLRHRNLVSLYGCSSRHSHELLLVYEYVPNGTVACHLHGDLAKAGLLSWPIRMKIAIETASALTYLHASDIIHRDVKTNNILLDNNFCVKVADFGLSRLFPNNVTHVSTAPKGTPGYLDPEYHQCYQLTSKSDVYSFGVVLIELISSLQAVDITRDRDEINLSNLAIKKIQKRAFSELVDPSLGFELDKEFKRKILSVAELAFQCLQADKDLRPSMVEVLEVLKRIDGGEDKPKHLEEADVRGSMTSQSSIHSAAPTSWFIEEFEATVPLQKAV